MSNQPHASDAYTNREDVISRWAILGLFFVVGGFFGAFNIQPIAFLKNGMLSTVTLLRETLQQEYDILIPNVHEGEGVTVNKDGAEKGLTVVQGLMPGGAQVRLYDQSGSELHRWKIDFFKIWDSYDHIVPTQNVPKSVWNYHTQGFHVLPDGSLLANISGKGLVKLGKCGNVEWRVDRMTHHSITAAPDGTFLVPGHKPLTQTDPALLPPGVSRDELARQVAGAMHNYENTILKISADGSVLKEFSVLRAVHDARMERELYDAYEQKLSDPLHLNDIEIVTEKLAARIDGVKPGDYLVSLRNMHTIAILDQDSGDLLWWKSGPWVRQHDPDITEDGMIEIFNNRSPLSGGFVNDSQIVRYDPQNDKIEVMHPIGQKDRFATVIMGTHQRLPAGNRLIAESTAGRVLEVTGSGELVWELVLPFDKERASLIEAAERVPLDYFQVRDWQCESKVSKE